MSSKIRGLNSYGQLEIPVVVRKHMSRLVRDKHTGEVVKVLPLGPEGFSERGKPVIVIDPALACGEPVIANTAIPAAVIAQRSRSGESVELLARDYGITRRAVEKAIDYFSAAA